ncbi:MAG: response regulator [Bermanella sp.]
MVSDFLFSTADDARKSRIEVPPGLKILSVDDESSAHDVTKLVLSNFKFEGAHPDIIIAMSAKEACEYMRQHDDVALVLLDVVMESDHAGFEVVETIRQELHNHRARIVIRTGQPGDMGMETTMSNYEVDGYVEKSSLTHNCLHATVYSALRTYKDAALLNLTRHAQADFIKKIQLLNCNHDTEGLYRSVAADINDFLPNVESIRIIISHKGDNRIDVKDLSPPCEDTKTKADASFTYILAEASEENATVQINNQLLFRHDLNNDVVFQLYVKTHASIAATSKSMFVSYAASVSTIYGFSQVA